MIIFLNVCVLVLNNVIPEQTRIIILYECIAKNGFTTIEKKTVRDLKMKHEALCFRKRTENEQMENVPLRNQAGGAFTTSEDSRVLDGESQSALGGNVKSIQMKPRQNERYDLSLFLQGKRANVPKHLEKELKEKKGAKWFISVQVKMVKYREDSNDEFSEPRFRSNCQRLLNLHELPEQYLACVEKVKESFQSYQREGSGWQLKEVKLVLCL